MRASAPRSGIVRAVLATALLTIPVSGCSSLFTGSSRSLAVAPSGLPWGEELVRRSLVMGAYDQALTAINERKDGAPNDDLLRALFAGQVAYYAGDWNTSTAAFAQADLLTEQRYTKSASRGVMSVITSDHALKYVPARTERLFSPYYAMLARVQSGDLEGAAVDARRLSAILEMTQNDLEPSERATHAALRDIAGAVFEAAGEWNDAGVAYRNAALLRGAERGAVDSIQVTRPLGDSATLLVLVESGFVAHYVEEKVAIQLDAAGSRRRQMRPTADDFGFPFVSDALAGVARSQGSAKVWDGQPVRSPTELTVPVVNRTVLTSPVISQGELVGAGDTAVEALLVPHGASGNPWVDAMRASPDGGVFAGEVTLAAPQLVHDGNDVSPSFAANSVATPLGSVGDDWTLRGWNGTRYLGDPSSRLSWLTVAMPSLVRPRLPNAPVGLLLAGTTQPDSAGDNGQPWSQALSVSDAANYSALVTDAVAADARRLSGARLARAATRFLTRSAATELVRETAGPNAGDVTSAIVSLFSAAVERADTRAWHLLPGRLTLLRVTVPSGSVALTVSVGGSLNATTIALDSFNARPGSVHIRTTRIWRDPSGTVPARLALQESNSVVPQ